MTSGINLSLCIAVLDSCVLYPAALRDLLLHIATPSIGLYRPLWTEEIEKEWVYNLLKNRPDLKQENLFRTIRVMREHFPASIVTKYKKIIPNLNLPDNNDRHVLAAGIKGKANFIVTTNVKDFPVDIMRLYSIKAIHPDDFISLFIESNFLEVCIAVKRQRLFLKNPIKSADELLTIFHGQGLIRTALALKKAIDLL